MDERTGDKYDIPDEETYGSALLNLFLFSGLMFTLPIATFFLGKQWLDENYPLEPPYDQACSLDLCQYPKYLAWLPLPSLFNRRNADLVKEFPF